MGFVDVGVEGLGEVGDAVFEFLHGAAEFAFVGFGVGEEAVKELGYVDGFDESELAGFGSVLEEDGVLRVFEDGIAGGVAGF